MGKIQGIIQLLFKGLLAGYILHFAFHIHTHPDKYTLLLSQNINSFAELFGISNDVEVNQSHLLYYCQLLAVMSLCIATGLKFGRVFGWIIIIINIALTWQKIQLASIGVHLLLLGFVI